MTSDEQNNMTDWKARLDTMEHTDGEPALDKAIAWEKTYQRLYGIRRNKKMIWYWTATACVGLVIIFLTIKMDRKPLPAARSVTEMPTAAKGLPPVSSPRETENMFIVSGKKKPTDLKVRGHLAMETPKHKVVTRPDTSAFTYVESTILPPSEINKDSSAVLISTVNVHKKLPVVHINELEENENADDRIADEIRTKDSKIRIKKDRKLTRRAMAISGSSSGHLIIEISLNN